MIILWSRYIVGQAVSLSLLDRFMCRRSRWLTALAGTSRVEPGRPLSDRHLLFGCGKNGKTLKNMLVSLVDIF